MQVIDNLLVVHNMDNKDSQIYDFKIQDYSRPLIKANLNIDTSYVDKDAFFSDVVFPEERDPVDDFRSVGTNPELEKEKKAKEAELKGKDFIDTQQPEEEEKKEEIKQEEQIEEGQEEGKKSTRNAVDLAEKFDIYNEQ
mmetsp:Transcript_69261/g.96042  ORF Transcript_69261/g.96042 Transcript_69261/m.96042 type:complete len:139 (+) Transcript_69261:1057-1473(+)